MYQLGRQVSDEGLEIDRVAVSGIGHFLEGAEHQLVLGVQAEGLGSYQDVPHVGLLVPGFGVEGEQVEQLLHVLQSQNRILHGVILSQDHGLLLFEDLLSAGRHLSIKYISKDMSS